MMHAIEPKTVKLLDGREVRVFLSMGGLYRLAQRFGMDSPDAVFRDVPAFKLAPPLLEEMIIDKKSIPVDEFLDNVDLTGFLEIVKSIVEVEQRPMEAPAQPEPPVN